MDSRPISFFVALSTTLENIPLFAVPIRYVPFSLRLAGALFSPALRPFLSHLPARSICTIRLGWNALSFCFSSAKLEFQSWIRLLHCSLPVSDLSQSNFLSYQLPVINLADNAIVSLNAKSRRTVVRVQNYKLGILHSSSRNFSSRRRFSSNWFTFVLTL